MSDTRPRIDYHEDHCPRCHVHRTRKVDRKDGRYHITIASACDDKDRCEKEIMSGFTFTREY